jgi:hypothetical protein
MADAIRWANSSDRLEREFAAGVLSDIGTTGAKKYLRALAHDTDKVVATSATEELAYPHSGTKDIEPKFLERADTSLEEQQAEVDQEQLADQSKPWRLIVPPMKGNEVDLNASYSKWSFEDGFDSEEQCEYGVSANARRARI